METEYAPRNIDIDADEIFISDGSKCDTGNIQEIFGLDNKVAVTDPFTRVCRHECHGGKRRKYVDGSYQNIVYLPCNAENNFVPRFRTKRLTSYTCATPTTPRE